MHILVAHIFFRLLYVTGRMSVMCCVVLESLGLSQVPALESIISQASKTLHLMSQSGLGESAFAQLSDIVPLCKQTTAS